MPLHADGWTREELEERGPRGRAERGGGGGAEAEVVVEEEEVGKGRDALAEDG